MKDATFIELLNLYLDHEILPEDTVRLEEEILRDPRRRETYRQYCRMHRACTMVAAHFLADAPEVNIPLANVADARLAGLAPHKSHLRWGMLASGLAAAACVSLVVIRFNRPAASTRQNTLAETAMVVANNQPVGLSDLTPVAVPKVAPVGSNHSSAYTPAVAERFLTAQTEPAESVNTAAFMVQSADLLPPMPAAPEKVNEFVFEPRTNLTPVNSRPFRGRGLMGEATVEMTAFQFQR